MIEAEELGINQANVKEFVKSDNPNVKRLLGKEGDIGKNLDLSADWALQIVTQVGNYEDIFARNLGPKTPLKIARGLNALWNQGGLQYPMPIR